MGEMLKADLDEIRSLGEQLRVKANEIEQIAVPVGASTGSVVMPEAGIDELLGALMTTLGDTVAKHCSVVTALAEGAAASVATYEAVEEVFSRQFDLSTERLGQP